MKIAYCSDTYIDFYVAVSNPQKLKKLIDKMLKPKEAPADAVVIAGGIGHYVSQNIAFLQELKEHYRDVVVVTGNPDLYLVSTEQGRKYQWNSFEKLNSFKKLCVSSGIHCLDGASIEIQGVTIGGLPMWYYVSNPNEWLS